MIYQRKEFVLKNGTKLILKSPEQSDAKMLLNQIVKTTSQTDYLLSTPNDFDEDISKEEEFISRFNDSNDYLICAYVDGIIVGNSALKFLKHAKDKIRSSVLVKIKKWWNTGVKWNSMKMVI